MDNDRPTAADRPGHGRVGGVDDPVARSEYGDDPEDVREIQRDAAGDLEDARQHATVYQLDDGESERPREIRHDPSGASLSVGDVVVIDGDAYPCERVGWTLIELREGERTPG